MDDGPFFQQVLVDAAEQIADLHWPTSVTTFSLMRRDPQLAAILKALTLPIRQATTQVNPLGARPEAVQLVADGLGLPVMDSSTARTSARVKGVRWADHQRQSLLDLVYGHYCVDSETEALTSRGWKRGNEIGPTDLLYTLNPATGAAEWQSLEKLHAYPGTHVVRMLDGRSHSSVTTLDHNWITRDKHKGTLRFTTTAKLNTNDRILLAAPPADAPTEAKYADALVELVAWYWTEGHAHPTGGVSIWQSETVNADKAARIRAALTTLFGPGQQSLRHGRGPARCGWRETSRIGGVSRGRVAQFYLDVTAASELRAIAPARVVSPTFLRSLTLAQLRLFVETSIDADGCRSGGRRSLAQKDGARLDSFEMACSLLGLPWTRTAIKNGHQTRIGTRAGIMPVAAARRGDRKMTDTITTVTDGVWCPQVPNRTWLARRRGTVWFTGNCFEEQYEITDATRLVRLSERLPITIRSIQIDREGDLAGIRQWATPGQAVAPQIPAAHLLWYSHDREGSAWHGQSILRPAYAAWMLKREMLRAHAIGNRRFNHGVPNVEWSPGSDPTPAQIADAAAFASAARAGDQSGASLPPGAHLVLTGLSGGVPDTLGFIQYLDQQMSRMVLAGMLDLGQTKNGSRALGAEFVDLFLLSIQALADDHASALTSQTAARIVEYNFGEDEPVPAVEVSDVGSKREVTVEALQALIGSGALEPDPALDAWIRRGWKLPERTAPWVQPAAKTGGAGVSNPNGPGASQLNAAAAPGWASPYLASPLRRQPTDAEKHTDFEALHNDRESALGHLLAAWPHAIAPQRHQVLTSVAASADRGDLSRLPSLHVDSATAADLLEAALVAVASRAADQMRAEAAAQGVHVPSALAAAGGDRVAAVTKAVLARLAKVASATAAVMAGGLAYSAAKEALRVWASGRPGDQVAADVESHLDSLSQTYVRDQLGGALHAAQSEGRLAVIEAADQTPTLAASEILDRNCCGPCQHIDGYVFPDLAAARAAYLTGGYQACEGRLRCRGIVTAVWR